MVMQYNPGQFNYWDWKQQQEQARQAQQNPQMPFSPSPEQSGMVPSGAGPQQRQGDPLIAAVLGIEALSPRDKKRAQMQAQADELRGMALGGQGVGSHWTGALARGLAGGLSGYQQRKIEEQRAIDAEERRRMMEQLGREY